MSLIIIKPKNQSVPLEELCLAFNKYGFGGGYGVANGMGFHIMRDIQDRDAFIEQYLESSNNQEHDAVLFFPNRKIFDANQWQPFLIKGHMMFYLSPHREDAIEHSAKVYKFFRNVDSVSEGLESKAFNELYYSNTTKDWLTFVNMKGERKCKGITPYLSFIRNGVWFSSTLISNNIRKYTHVKRCEICDKILMSDAEEIFGTCNRCANASGYSNSRPTQLSLIEFPKKLQPIRSFHYGD